MINEVRNHLKRQGFIRTGLVEKKKTIFQRRAQPYVVDSEETWEWGAAKVTLYPSSGCLFARVKVPFYRRCVLSAYRSLAEIRSLLGRIDRAKAMVTQKSDRNRGRSKSILLAYNADIIKECSDSIEFVYKDTQASVDLTTNMVEVLLGDTVKKVEIGNFLLIVHLFS